MRITLAGSLASSVKNQKTFPKPNGTNRRQRGTVGKEENFMKVIGAGLGRTGTKSLQAALEQLGFGPCYHMTEVIEHPEHVPTWLAAAAKQSVDWATFLNGYQATVDFPGCSYYQEMMAAFPDAKVLLSVRDPDRWYASCLETIYAISHKLPMRWVGRFMPRMGAVMGMANHIVWQQMFEGRFLDRDFAIARFHQHTEEVKRVVPQDKLLIFDVKQGWEPLCKFLGVPVPEGVPFPHMNDTAEFKQRIVRLQVVQTAALAVLGAAAVWLGCRLLGRGR